MNNLLDSKDEDLYDHDLDIENEPQEYPNPYLAPTCNQRPKLAEKLIEATKNSARDLDDRIRTRPRYQNEHVTLFTQLIYLQSGATKFQRDAT